VQKSKSLIWAAEMIFSYDQNVRFSEIWWALFVESRRLCLLCAFVNSGINQMEAGACELNKNHQFAVLASVIDRVCAKGQLVETMKDGKHVTGPTKKPHSCKWLCLRSLWTFLCEGSSMSHENLETFQMKVNPFQIASK
jgi:hypothetical protein